MLKDEKGKDRTDSNKNPITKEIALTDIMDNTFADYEVYKPQLSPKFKPNKVGKLKGDFTPTQTKRFFERYELIHHIPNTLSGFSATIFYDISQQEYIIAFRGTELGVKDIISDTFLATYPTIAIDQATL